MDAETNKLRIEQEIAKINDKNIQDFLVAAIGRFPEYFWTAPASNSYHYPDERKKGGLVLHVRRLCNLTETFVRFLELSMWERNILLAACILHDSFSRGVPPNEVHYSVPFHPLYPREQLPYNTFADRYISQQVYEEIMECVESHLGRFSPSPLLHSKKKLPSLFQTIDHIGSRENILIEI